MKERPILFSGPMIKAILEGRKVMTRRVIPFDIPDDFDPIRLPTGKWSFQRPGKRHLEIYSTEAITCPYGQPGDSLWVRETWADRGRYKLQNDDGTSTILEARFTDICYKATATEINLTHNPKWRSPITMPRWASRLTLEITSIRVERLQNISEDDAKAEGVEPNCEGDWQTCPGCIAEGAGVCLFKGEYIHYLRGMDDLPAFSARESFESLWDSINAKRGYGWDSNPYVWCISFRVAG